MAEYYLIMALGQYSNSGTLRIVSVRILTVIIKKKNANKAQYQGQPKVSII